MGVMPFICLGLGIVMGFFNSSKKILKLFDQTSQLALMLLMFTIGMGAGMDPLIIRNLPVIGLKCAGTAFLAILFSVLFVFAVEKTLLDLSQLSRAQEGSVELPLNGEQEKDTKKRNAETGASGWSFGAVVPVCLTLGIGAGYLTYRMGEPLPTDGMLFFSLVILYTGVGAGMGSSSDAFKGLKQLGLKILLVPFAILLGSLAAGVCSGLLFRIPFHVSVVSSGGMSYYSMTGAFMTEAYGAEAGTYGFLVNVFRELLTVLLLPLLVRISKGSAVAAGAAGNMDTMLLPVINWAGKETGVIALITGTVLTFVVPFLLPVLIHLL